MTDKKKKNPIGVAFGSLGGAPTHKRKRLREDYVAMGLKGSSSRWKNHQKKLLKPVVVEME